MAMHSEHSGGRIRDGASKENLAYIEFALDAIDALTQKRWMFEREWYRNILYYIGQQWITYEETFRRWRTRNLPRWVPLPVTNRLSSTVNVIRSSVAPIVSAFPA